MRAITVHQYWASAIMLGLKSFETRSWAPNFTGPLAIHAGLAAPRQYRDLFIREPFWSLFASRRLIYFEQLPLGCVLGVAWLVAGHPTEALAGRISKQEDCLGDFSAGRFGWEFESVMPFASPVPARGAHKIWNWEPSDELRPVIEDWAKAADTKRRNAGKAAS